MRIQLDRQLRDHCKLIMHRVSHSWNLNKIFKDKISQNWDKLILVRLYGMILIYYQMMKIMKMRRKIIWNQEQINKAIFKRFMIKILMQLCNLMGQTPQIFLSLR
jgi:hypothetical protein